MINLDRETSIQFIKFCINGGLLGLVAWGLQQFLYTILNINNSYGYALATCLTFFPLVFINFLIQRTLIFRVPGLFVKFLLSNMLMMATVTILSFVCKDLLTHQFGADVGRYLGFLVANLIVVVPSFMLKKYWVFSKVEK